MSKSLGNVINPFDLVEKYGTDAVRYYLLREVLPTEDGDFTYEKFEQRYNSDLAGGIGNLVAAGSDGAAATTPPGPCGCLSFLSAPELLSPDGGVAFARLSRSHDEPLSALFGMSPPIPFQRHAGAPRRRRKLQFHFVW